jgi:hypothetical protein
MGKILRADNTDIEQELILEGLMMQINLAAEQT